LEGDACIKSITSVNFISWDYMGINGFLWEFKKKIPFDKIIHHLVC